MFRTSTDIPWGCMALDFRLTKHLILISENRTRSNPHPVLMADTHMIHESEVGKEKEKPITETKNQEVKNTSILAKLQRKV